ncbi:putative sugar kinase YdjH [Anaerohalosphaera lusitana]|uniref:Putative sugar kinase YdjH n=1 Tax=Anaerohalosphaera lusitana TaxID=1936003 RepID=A0A1U9NM66_9BACT|nr:adenosine kinase [Anaerohalosphaera lusitana]AQT68818.1 putative sugar kinase YdjH [Anaerohalosphaera lusitana]
MSRIEKKITGVGSPIMDLLSHVPDEFVSTHAGEKGGMALVDHDAMEALLSRLDEFPKLAAGGSAANTIFALARLETPCGFVGKLGDDAQAKEYLQHFEKFGGDTSGFKFCTKDATARCLSLVTPDYERTMCTCLGAAANLAPDEISISDFEGYSHVHLEGYLLFNQDLIKAILKHAKDAGCTVSLDLGSFQIVESFKDLVTELLDKYVDIVFANEDEAEAFSGSKDPEESLKLLGKYCDIAVVKLGAEGSFIQNTEGKVKVVANPVESVVDTTGAGDYWAAGFLCGYLRGYPMNVCGEMGSILGAEVVQQLGAELPDDRWSAVAEQFNNIHT